MTIIICIFCAKDDFSGYSNFAATWEQHIVNARKYQKHLTNVIFIHKNMFGIITRKIS